MVKQLNCRTIGSWAISSSLTENGCHGNLEFAKHPHQFFIFCLESSLDHSVSVAYPAFGNGGGQKVIS